MSYVTVSHFEKALVMHTWVIEPLSALSSSANQGFSVEMTRSGKVLRIVAINVIDWNTLLYIILYNTRL